VAKAVHCKGMILPLLLSLHCCAMSPSTPPAPSHGAGSKINTRFVPPKGFVREVHQAGTFAHWLGEQELHPEGTSVMLYNGELKNRQDVHAAVLRISVGKKDLQQCADAVMRLRAEHLFAEQRYADIHFHFTSGFNAEYSRWIKGERIAVKGNVCSWKSGGMPKNDHATLSSFMEIVFSYAGTLSLSKELKSAGTSSVQPGDVFIHGGSPGHAVIVMDVATHADGRQAFLIAQSYMPAQQIHVLKNTRRPELGAWFIFGDGDKLYTPEWTFDWSDRKRW